MKQDITSIMSVDGAKIEFCGKSGFSPLIFCGSDFSFPQDVEIKGEIANVAGKFILKASVSGELITACARCGAPAKEHFSFDIEEKLIKGSEIGTEEEAVFFEGSEIDITELAVNGFIMNASSKYLCKEDCKGLCPVCGKNRNLEGCDCEENSVDPRFSVLDNLKF